MGTSGRELTHDEISAIIRMRCAGTSLREIERALDVTRPTIVKHAPRHVVREWLVDIEGRDPVTVDAMLEKNFRAG